MSSNSRRANKAKSIVYMKDEEQTGGYRRRYSNENSSSDLPTVNEIPRPVYEEIPESESKIGQFLPIIPTISSYSKDLFFSDIQSALTVSFVLIPQAIAFSGLAGVTPMRALVSAVYPLIFYAIFGASRQLSVGPEALSSVLVGATVMAEVERSGADPNVLASLLGFLVGIFAIMLTAVRAGFIDNLLSGYVLVGFVTGVATLIIVEQLPGIFGVAIIRDKPESTMETLMHVFEKIQEDPHPAAFVLGVTSLVFLLSFKFGKKYLGPKYPWLKLVPEILVLVVITTTLSAAMDFKSMGIPTLGVFDNSIPTPRLPPFDFARKTFV